jgi:hypothetical protein
LLLGVLLAEVNVPDHLLDKLIAYAEADGAETGLELRSWVRNRLYPFAM